MKITVAARGRAVKQGHFERMDDTMSEGLIRPAVAGDAAAVTKMIDASYALYVPRMGKKPAPMLDDYAALIARDLVTILEVAGKLAGAIVTLVEADHVFVETVGVDPAFQGRGFGRRLLDVAEAQARAKGLSELRLYTNAMMTENLAMYPKLGWVETHRVTEKGYDRVYFTKAL